MKHYKIILLMLYYKISVYVWLKFTITAKAIHSWIERCRQAAANNPA